jgi:hypothetical protein
MPNRRRDLLHRNKLPDFLKWAEKNGYTPLAVRTGTYEVARLEKLTQRTETPPVIVIYRREKGEHLTTTGEGTKLVWRFLKTNNKRARRAKDAADALAAEWGYVK